MRRRSRFCSTLLFGTTTTTSNHFHESMLLTMSKRSYLLTFEEHLLRTKKEDYHEEKHKQNHDDVIDQTSTPAAAHPCHSFENPLNVSRELGKFFRNKSKETGCRPNSVAVMLGAGVSVAAGIPDFRSQRSGLYSTICSKYGLKAPEQIFDLEYFRTDPGQFGKVCTEMSLWPDPKRNPTDVHRLVKWLEDEDLLLRCYTQNIDGLERKAGVSSEKLVEAHGTFSAASCIDCGAEYEISEVKAEMDGGHVMRCTKCLGGLVKPNIVFFQESMPERFHKQLSADIGQTDVLLVIGTSLAVWPFASLASRLMLVLNERFSTRVIINREPIEKYDSWWDRPMTVMGEALRRRDDQDDDRFGEHEEGKRRKESALLMKGDVFVPGDCQVHAREILQSSFE